QKLGIQPIPSPGHIATGLNTTMLNGVNKACGKHGDSLDWRAAISCQNERIPTGNQSKNPIYGNNLANWQ
ncbi:MAG: hypothetical protein PUD39_09035, partial [Bacteroidales bacterium]|nr:hypothetical protein [Bacteroidales bacterium]